MAVDVLDAYQYTVVRSYWQWINNDVKRSISSALQQS